jgi:hypothetical protein
MARATVCVIVLGATVLALGGGCKPDLGAPPSQVTGPRVLAIRSTPPEAKPDDVPITYDVLLVDVGGTVASPDADLGWAQCNDPHPPAESNIVSSACLAIPDDTTAPTFTAPLPAEACMNFGPIPSMPGARPSDPDTTGGYYQPVRMVWHSAAGEQLAVALERALCSLGYIASTDIAGAYDNTYPPNTNPTLTAVTLDPGGAATPLFVGGGAGAQPPATVAAGQPVTLEASWDAASRETFPVYDLLTHQLVTQSESLRLSWFATAGVFQHDRTGRGETESETFTDDVWTAPTTAGPVHLWFVLRDSRGGVDYAEAEIDVTP